MVGGCGLVAPGPEAGSPPPRVRLLPPSIIHGTEVLDAMEKVETNAKNRPLKEIALHRITIHANPFADDETVLARP